MAFIGHSWATAGARVSAFHRRAYTDDLNELLKRFLEASGFDVAAVVGLGIVGNVEIGNQPPEVAYDLGRRVFAQAPDAEALFISCGGLRTFEVLDALEEDLGVPVTSSSQATWWNCLRMSGIRTPISGFGSLLTLP